MTMSIYTEEKTTAKYTYNWWRLQGNAALENGKN